MTTTTRFDAAALRAGIEGRDPSVLAGLYAPDARIEIVDAENPPSRPRVVEGREAIAAHLDDVCGREMTHYVDRIAVDGEALGYSIACEYPDGTRVRCSATADVRDGRIARESVVQAWDV